jgi:hypothetical protein
MSMQRARTLAATAAIVLSRSIARHDCGAQDNADDLAKASQNPVADMVSFPLQFNFNSGGALQSRTAMLLNVQPVMPLPLDKEWLVVAMQYYHNVERPELGGANQFRFVFTPLFPIQKR